MKINIWHPTETHLLAKHEQIIAITFISSVVNRGLALSTLSQCVFITFTGTNQCQSGRDERLWIFPEKSLHFSHRKEAQPHLHSNVRITSANVPQYQRCCLAIRAPVFKMRLIDTYVITDSRNYNTLTTMDIILLLIQGTRRPIEKPITRIQLPSMITANKLDTFSRCQMYYFGSVFICQHI